MTAGAVQKQFWIHMIRTLDEAKTKLEAADITDGYRANLLALVQSLINAPADCNKKFKLLCAERIWI